MQEVMKADWVKALRSGKYNQANGVLCNGTAYCCLGVLCAVAGAEFQDLEVESENGSDEVEVLLHKPVLDGKVLAGSNGWDDTLTYEFIQDLGITLSEQDHLVNMNDVEKRTFDEIADWIEENL